MSASKKSFSKGVWLTPTTTGPVIGVNPFNLAPRNKVIFPGAASHVAKGVSATKGEHAVNVGSEDIRSASGHLTLPTALTRKQYW